MRLVRLLRTHVPPGSSHCILRMHASLVILLRKIITIVNSQSFRMHVNFLIAIFYVLFRTIIDRFYLINLFGQLLHIRGPFQC